jgi:integrase
MRSFMVGDLDANPGPQSVLRIFQGLRKFIQWSYDDGLRSFDGLTVEICALYREYVTSRLTFHGVSKRLSGGAIASLLQPLRVVVAYLALTRREFADDAQTYRDVTDWGDTSAEFPTLRIPDEFALPLMQAAISYVTDAGTALTTLHNAVVRLARLSTAQRVGDKARVAHRHRRRLAHERGYTIQLGGERIDLSLVTGGELLRLIRLLETACYIIIAGLTGMRVSSIGSLQRGCLLTKPARNGRVLLLLSGLLFKGRGVRAMDFIAGWDDVRDRVNPIRLAVETIGALRAATGTPSPYLFLGPGAMYAGTEQPLSASALNRRLDTFAAVCGVSGWHFASHQFRRTFARFVTKKDFNTLLPLQRHFGHVSAIVTAGYAQWDTELLSEVLDERFEQDLEAVDHMLQSERLGGAKGREIAAANTLFRGSAGAVLRAEYIERLRKVQQSDPLLLLRHRYGYCIYVAELAACGGDASNIGLGTCLPCANFVVGPRHFEFWEMHVQSLRAQAALKTFALLPEPTRRDFLRLLETAEHILLEIGDAAGLRTS